jgi:hypothetical protein
MNINEYKIKLKWNRKIPRHSENAFAVTHCCVDFDDFLFASPPERARTIVDVHIYNADLTEQQIVIAVTLQNNIWEVLCSNLDRDIDYPD